MNLIQTFLINHRLRSLIIFIGCVFLLGMGYILQYIVGLTPCPLCILQRFFFALTGFTGLLIFIRKPDEHTLKTYSYFMLAFSLLGGGIAARQVWIQHNPPSLLGVKCIPGLESITDLIASVFQATADCAEKGWTLMSLSIPEWSLIAFIILTIVSTIPFWKKD